MVEKSVAVGGEGGRGRLAILGDAWATIIDTVQGIRTRNPRNGVRSSYSSNAPCLPSLFFTFWAAMKVPVSGGILTSAPASRSSMVRIWRRG